MAEPRPPPAPVTTTVRPANSAFETTELAPPAGQADAGRLKKGM
jgi:hypothetical protein